MQKALLIAEKPSLMREIQSVYSKHKSEIPYDITFVAQVGHLLELIGPDEYDPALKVWDVNMLPIFPDKMGGWKYKVKSETKDVFKKIKTEVTSGNYDVIIHAGDADQEGEVLVNETLSALKNTLPVLRFWSNDTTEENVLKGLKNLQPDTNDFYQNLNRAAIVRSHADWMFGMNGSRAIADKLHAFGNKVAVGRVMTWIQTMIVEREDEIKNFIPKTVYGVSFESSNGLLGNLYEIPNGNSSNETKKKKEEDESSGLVFFDTEQEAQNIISSLPLNGIVVSKKSEQAKTYPPKLYELATIQIDASKRGYDSGKTLEIIQSLYEKKYVSYPRTECNVLSSNENFAAMIHSAMSIPDFVDAGNEALTRIGYIKGIKKYVNDAELTKHGHSAIVPTTVAPVLSTLTPDERVIYEMICKRFLAAFLPPMIQNKTVILSKIGDKTFRSTGKTMVDEGYTTFLGYSQKDTIIPDMNENDSFSVETFNITERTSTCPKRYTDGTMIQLMQNPSKYIQNEELKAVLEDFSIGMPSTRAVIIDKLVKNKYVKRQKGNILSPTDYGAFMIHAIHNTPLCKTDMTGQWDRILSKLREGEVTFDYAESYMKKEVVNLIEQASLLEDMTYDDGYVANIICDCPECGGTILEGKKNFYCSGYKDKGCEYSVFKNYMGSTITKSYVKRLFSGKEIEKVVTKSDGSKSWPQKLYFDKIEHRIKFVPKVVTGIEGCNCPECGSAIERNGSVVQCSSSNCNFKLWIDICSHVLTDDEIRDVLNSGHTHKIPNLKGKSGKVFAARLKLVKKPDGKYGFDMSFK